MTAKFAPWLQFVYAPSGGSIYGNTSFCIHDSRSETSAEVSLCSSVYTFRFYYPYGSLLTVFAAPRKRCTVGVGSGEWKIRG